VRWLGAEQWPPWFDRMVLMFQREVAERIVAAPGTRDYGRLAVLAGWRTESKILFDVAPSAFVPPPKVISSVVRLVPRATPLACARASLERVTAAAFGQRRKMLRASLRSLGGDPDTLLRAAGIDPAERAERVPVEGFVALANAFDAAGAGGTGSTGSAGGIGVHRGGLRSGSFDCGSFDCGSFDCGSFDCGSFDRLTLRCGPTISFAILAGLAATIIVAAEPR
jgi:16S rRNA (adenine1518-N6/adenine1519-N6)-dimethyltransferase